MIHGYLEDQDTSPYLLGMTSQLSLEQCTVLVDYTGGNKLNYWQAIANARTVGAVVGFHATNMVKKVPGIKTKIVGFSLGGQIIGEAARFFTDKTGQKISTCHGLDIAGPMYDGCKDEIRLTANLCDDVQVAHSDAMLMPVLPAVTGMGSGISSGKADYWINCGHIQGGTCLAGLVDIGKVLALWTGGLQFDDSTSVTSTGVSVMLCSHFRSAFVYLSQLKGSCVFKGSSCPNCGSSCTSPILLAGNAPFMQASNVGDYKVKTSNTGSYCPGF
jgi:hypothetical protein